MYYKPDNSLRVWYKNLKERVKLNVLQKYKAVWEKYNQIIKVLVKPSKDPCAWLRNWTVAIKKAAVYSIITANKPWTWIISFIKVIKYWKPNWESNYNTVYEEKIKAGTLLFKKIISDFKKEFNKIKKKDKGKVVKGFFGLTFNGVRNNKDNIKKKTLFLKKKERAIIIYQRCIICKRPTYKKLKTCYYAFPKIAPKGGTPLTRT